MKIIIFYACLSFCSLAAFAQQKLKTVNAVLQDESYVVTFGILPDAATNEQERILIHLSYAEHLLRISTPANLTYSQLINRILLIDLLHQYWTAGNFPVNRDYPGERKPCFIDADGNICAVGYLIEQTKGREFAEKINAAHQYDLLADMKEPAIDTWANEFGVTLEECAMIQPTYGPPPAARTSNADIKTGYGISSGLIVGTNIAINVANISNRLQQNPAISYIGLVTGTGQVIMGIANVKQTTSLAQINGGETYTSYKAQNNLSYVNIAIGTTTIITSALNLALQKKIKDNRNAFNLYSYPNDNNSLTMGLSFMRKI